jgi:hypothetical protein
MKKACALLLFVASNCFADRFGIWEETGYGSASSFPKESFVLAALGIGFALYRCVKNKSSEGLIQMIFLLVVLGMALGYPLAWFLK